MTMLQTYWGKVKRWVISLLGIGVAFGASQIPVIDKTLPLHEVATLGTGCYQRFSDGSFSYISEEVYGAFAQKNAPPVDGMAWCGTKFDRPENKLAVGDYYSDGVDKSVRLEHRLMQVKDLPQEIEFDEVKQELRFMKKAVDLILPANAAITLDTVTSTQAEPAASLTKSMTVGSGANQLFVLAVSAYGTQRATASSSWNGDLLTLARQGDGNNINVSVWHLANPDVGTFNFVVTQPAETSGVAAAGYSLFGAAQTGLPNASSSASFNAGNVTSTATTNAVTWGFDAIGDQTATMAPVSGQTGVGTIFGDTGGFSYEQNSAAGTVSMGWNWAGTDNGRVTAVWYAEAAAAAASTRRRSSQPLLIE